MAEYMYTIKVTREDELTATELNQLKTELLNDIEDASNITIQMVQDDDSRFVVISDENRYHFGSTGYIVYDKYTGVEYFVSNDIHNKGNITPLLDSSGNPLIYGATPTPPTPGEDYATKTYVDDKVTSSLTNYSTKTYVDNKIAQIDTSTFATREWVLEQLAGIVDGDNRSY